jgi:hypothetical protein
MIRLEADISICYKGMTRRDGVLHEPPTSADDACFNSGGKVMEQLWWDAVEIRPAPLTIPVSK